MWYDGRNRQIKTSLFGISLHCPPQTNKNMTLERILISLHWLVEQGLTRAWAEEFVIGIKGRQPVPTLLCVKALDEPNTHQPIRTQICYSMPSI